MNKEAPRNTFNPNIIYQKLAKIKGRKPNDLELRLLYEKFVSEISDNPEFHNSPPSLAKQKRLKSVESRYFFPSDTPRMVAEKTQRIAHLTEILFDTPRRFTSYGDQIPSYHEELQKQRNRKPHKNHRALFVGAMTPEGIEEFAKTVKTTHPDASCNVIDIEGETTSKIDRSIASFIYGSGTQMPFTDNTFDSVHTNYLLTSLLRVPPDQINDTLSRFLSETERVLKPHGVLLCAELNIFTHLQNLQALIEKTGLAPSMYTPTHFTSKRDIFRYPHFTTNPTMYKEPAEVFIAAIKKKKTNSS